MWLLTYRLLLIAYCLLLYCLSLIALLPIAYCFIAYRLLLIAHRLLPTACCHLLLPLNLDKDINQRHRGRRHSGNANRMT